LVAERSNGSISSGGALSEVADDGARLRYLLLHVAAPNY